MAKLIVMLIHSAPGTLVWPAAMIVWGPGFRSPAHSHHSRQNIGTSDDFSLKKLAAVSGLSQSAFYARVYRIHRRSAATLFPLASTPARGLRIDGRTERDSRGSRRWIFRRRSFDTNISANARNHTDRSCFPEEDEQRYLGRFVEDESVSCG